MKFNIKAAKSWTKVLPRSAVPQWMKVLNWSATAVRSPAVDERTRYIRGFYIQFIMQIMSIVGLW